MALVHSQGARLFAFVRRVGAAIRSRGLAPRSAGYRPAILLLNYERFASWAGDAQADDGIRTRDLHLGTVACCSYTTSAGSGRRGSHPRSSPWEGDVLLAPPRPHEEPRGAERGMDPAGVAPAFPSCEGGVFLLDEGPEDSGARIRTGVSWSKARRPTCWTTPECRSPRSARREWARRESNPLARDGAGVTARP